MRYLSSLLMAFLMMVVSVASAQQTPIVRQQAGSAARQAAAQAAADAAPMLNTMPSTPENNQRDVIIRLERTPCFGNCAAYSVTILGDRSVTFVARDGRTDAKQHQWSCCDLVRKKVLSLNDYNHLVAQIEAMDFFKLKNDYSLEVTDGSSVTITVAAFDSVHRVHRYMVPCETEYRNLTTAKRDPRNGPDPNDLLKGVTPPPDSLCKLESLIDRLSGADQWGEDTKFHWHGK